MDVNSKKKVVREKLLKNESFNKAYNDEKYSEESEKLVHTLATSEKFYSKFFKHAEGHEKDWKAKLFLFSTQILTKSNSSFLKRAVTTAKSIFNRLFHSSQYKFGTAVFAGVSIGSILLLYTTDGIVQVEEAKGLSDAFFAIDVGQINNTQGQVEPLKNLANKIVQLNTTEKVMDSVTASLEMISALGFNFIESKDKPHTSAFFKHVKSSAYLTGAYKITMPACTKSQMDSTYTISTHAQLDEIVEKVSHIIMRQYKLRQFREVEINAAVPLEVKDWYHLVKSIDRGFWSKILNVQSDVKENAQPWKMGSVHRCPFESPEEHSLIANAVDTVYNQFNADIIPLLNNKFADVQKSDNAVSIVLSIDGGGMRGIIPIVILQCLKEMYTKRFGKSDLIDKLSLVGGTSVGSILAFAIQRRIDENKALDIFKRLGKEVFAKKPIAGHYNEAVLESLLSKHLFDSKPITLQDCKSLQPKVFATSCMNAMPYLFRTYTIEEESDTYPGSCDTTTLVDAIRASSAAPTYFKAKEMHQKHFYDGGIVMNNPSLAAYYESLLVAPTKPVILVSLGTGLFNKAYKSQLKSFSDLVQFCSNTMQGLDYIVESATNSQTTAKLFENRNITYTHMKQYVRFNPYFDMEPIKLNTTDEKSLETMIQKTKEYMNSDEVKAQVKQLFDMLQEYENDFASDEYVKKNVNDMKEGLKKKDVKINTLMRKVFPFFSNIMEKAKEKGKLNCQLVQCLIQFGWDEKNEDWKDEFTFDENWRDRLLAELP